MAHIIRIYNLWTVCYSVALTGFHVCYKLYPVFYWVYKKIYMYIYEKHVWKAVVFVDVWVGMLSHSTFRNLPYNQPNKSTLIFK